jgi:hypothetical protein
MRVTRWRRVLVSSVVSVALVLALAAGATAAPSERTFHGTWTSATWTGCDPFGNDTHPVAGIWNVTLLANGRANVHWNLWEVGFHFVIGGVNHGDSWQQVATWEDGFELAALDGMTTLTLDSGTLNLHIEPYWVCSYADAYGTLLH